ncbi:hypothetical protein BDN67DRAFT_1054916 [Paxillus ammoniavirescens]|nr:hypothetical protein BDN67DRAFT_1054916 [Paxillus ammoniavirescens]
MLVSLAVALAVTGLQRKTMKTSQQTASPSPFNNRKSLMGVNGLWEADPASGVAFHRLAPLGAPRFGTRTPQSKAEMDTYVKRQAKTMKRLRIRDMDNSDEDWGIIENNDSGCEVKEDNVVAGKKLFVYRLALLSRRSQSRPLSPKPVCLELLESVHQTLSPPTSPQTANKPRSRTSTTAPNYAATAASLHVQTGRASIFNRHSYAGPGSETMSPLPWSLCSTTLNMPSPDSLPTSPTSLPHGSHDIMDNEDDMFLEPCEPPETSFVFSIMEGTPSPRSKKVQEMLPSKYKPRDSGVAFSDDEDTSNSRGNPLSAMPRTLTSVSSLNSNAGDDLVTLIARFLAAYPQVARGHMALLHAINVARHECGKRPSQERQDHEP